MFKKIFLLFLLFLPCVSFATNDTGMKSVDEILAAVRQQSETKCASKVFADALAAKKDDILDDAPEEEVRAWAQTVMFDADVLDKVLECPEIKNKHENETIYFTPIIFEFDTGREITINYTTQPKVLKQKAIVARKPSTPSDVPNPKLMDYNDPAKYINTNPSWYAIMVVQHDSLKDFVGKGKNNTLSFKYMEEHFDEIYPKGAYCTSEDALALNGKTINQTVRRVADLEDDSNDYFVFGNNNLEWIMYAEIAAEIVMTVVSFGGFAAADAGIKMWRLTKNMAHITKSMQKLYKASANVRHYAEVAKQIATKSEKIEKITTQMKHVKDYEKYMTKANKLRSTNPDKAKKLEKQAELSYKKAKKLDPSLTKDKFNATDLAKEQQKLTKEMKQAEKEADEILKADDAGDVKKFKEQAAAIKEATKVMDNIKNFRRPQTGNIFARSFKAIKGLRNANKVAKTTARVAQKSMSTFSGTARNWLFNNTLRFGGKFAKAGLKLTTIYAIIAFAGDLFDRTSSTSSEFTNGIEMMPIALLGADDLEGQENVVNYGMWFMWTASSADPVDDDAAYLQATDFATKFHSELVDYQDENGANCNVDIYIVHPIIRLDETNSDNAKDELFWLFMNDEPFTTAYQFE